MINQVEEVISVCYNRDSGFKEFSHGIRGCIVERVKQESCSKEFSVEEEADRRVA